MEGEDFVLPTTEGGGFGGLASAANDLLGKVNSIPFDQIGKSLNGILKSVNDATQGPQLKKALTDLSAMIASAQGMIQRLDTKQLPQTHRRTREDFDERQQIGHVARHRVRRQHQVQPRSRSAYGAGQ